MNKNFSLIIASVIGVIVSAIVFVALRLLNLPDNEKSIPTADRVSDIVDNSSDPVIDPPGTVTDANGNGDHGTDTDTDTDTEIEPEPTGEDSPEDEEKEKRETENDRQVREAIEKNLNL